MLHNTPQIIQTSSANVGADTTTTSTTFVDLLSLTMYINSNPVVIYFSVSGNNTTASTRVSFQLVIDGIATRGFSYICVSSGNGGSGAIVYKTQPLFYGNHTFKIQWLTSGGTAQVLAGSGASDNAYLVVDEVTI